MLVAGTIMIKAARPPRTFGRWDFATRNEEQKRREATASKEMPGRVDNFAAAHEEIELHPRV